MKFEETLYLIPADKEAELYEQLLAKEFHNFYIEQLVGKKPLLKLYLSTTEDRQDIKGSDRELWLRVCGFRSFR